MILRKAKQLIIEFREIGEKLENQNQTILVRNENLKKQNETIISQNAELEWANIYHDTIRDKEWLKNLSISPGRWAANYSLFYILVRILSDYQPINILELGLGESSKVISCFLDNQLKDSNHVVIEQDASWISCFKTRFELSKNSEILHLPIETKIIKEFQVNCYREIEKKINHAFDLYIVDGPFGSTNFSRYDICLLAQNLNQKDEFIIIIDDFHRKGEKETVHDLINQLTVKGIKTFTGNYHGDKEQIVITTEKFRLATSL